MAIKLQRLQNIRSRFGWTKSHAQYTHLCGEFVKSCRDADGNFDSAAYDRIMDLVFKYGQTKESYGFWDGCVTGYLNQIEMAADEFEREEYAAEAAASAQAELLDPDKPDHPHDRRCDGAGTG